MIQPNIIRGGTAIPFNYNLFLMKGRKHSQGGIDVGKDLEVEGGEVMQTSPNEVRVFSAQKFLGGESPANLVLKGANPNAVFAMQEQYKQMNGINDDGTKKKAKNGLVKRFLNWIGIGNNNSPVKENNKQKAVEGTVKDADGNVIPANVLKQIHNMYITNTLDAINEENIRRARSKTTTNYITTSNVFGEKKVISMLNDAKKKIRELEGRNDLTNQQKDELKRAKSTLNDIKSTDQEVWNCINNLREVFPTEFPTGTETFQNGDDKTQGYKALGYTEIPDDERRIGDLAMWVYNGGVRDQRARHAMMYNGVDENGINRYNSSRGEKGDQHWRINHDFPKIVYDENGNSRDVRFFRFTGTPSDSITWKNEADRLLQLGELSYSTDENGNVIEVQGDTVKPKYPGGLGKGNGVYGGNRTSQLAVEAVANNNVGNNNTEFKGNKKQPKVVKKESAKAEQPKVEPQKTDSITKQEVKPVVKDTNITQVPTDTIQIKPIEQESTKVDSTKVDSTEVKPIERISKNKNVVKALTNYFRYSFKNGGKLNTINDNSLIKNKNNMNNKQYNAQVLGYVPSTGRQIFASGGRKRALMGKIGETYENIFKLPTLDFKKVEDEKFNDLVKNSGIKGLDIDVSKFSPLNLTEDPFIYKSNGKAILRKPVLGSDGNIYNSFADMPRNVHPSLTSTNLLNNDNNVTDDNKPIKRKSIKEKLIDKYGPQSAGYFLGNGILHGVSALTGLAGASANAISNAHYLNKMKSIVDSIKSYDIPITKLKTFYNINPQLSEVERKLGLTTRDIDANTASSQVALARKRNARYNASAEKNKLYAQKENIETQLINQDLLQQGQTIAKNIQNRQNVEHQKAMLNMQLLDKRSENETKMLETYAAILNQFANNGGNAIYNWLRYKAALAGNPNSVEAMSHV